MHKELADFDFSCISSLSKQRVLDLARGAYIDKVEPVILVGNPGLGKSHVATGLALAACRQGHRVRFYTTAGLVNELILAFWTHAQSYYVKNGRPTDEQAGIKSALRYLRRL